MIASCTLLILFPAIPSVWCQTPEWITIFKVCRIETTEPYQYRKTDTRAEKRNIINPTGNHTATIFFLHDIGQDGAIMKEEVMQYKNRGIKIPHPYIKFVFLTAPPTYVQSMNQEVLAWYDIEDPTPNRTEKWELLEPVIAELKQFIIMEIDQEIMWERIIMGGFAMGGSMALNIGFSYGYKMGGIFALSSFLPSKAALWDEMQRRPRNFYPRLFWYHGKEDKLVPMEWALNSFDKLTKEKITAEFHSDPDLGHWISYRELRELFDWFEILIPESFVTATPSLIW